MNGEYICIVCPKGCHIKVEGDNITGYSCPRGLAYVKQESINPLRNITSTVLVTNREFTLLPVRTSDAIPKNMIFPLMEEIKKVRVSAPIKMHDIIIKNVLNLGVDVIATKEVE